MQEYLTEAEIAKIEYFVSDEVLFQAVKKVLLQQLYTRGVLIKGESHNPLKNRALAMVGNDVKNEELGSQLRSLWEGINALEVGFNELEGIKGKKVEEKEPESNEAV